MLGKALIVFLALLTTSQLNDDTYLVVETCDGRTQFFPGERICVRLTGMVHDDCPGDLLVYVYVYSYGDTLSIQEEERLQEGKILSNTKKVIDETITFHLPKTGEYVLRGAVICSRAPLPSGDWEWVVFSNELRIVVVRKCQETVIRKECSSDGKWVYAYILKENCEIEKRKIESCSFGCKNGECLPEPESRRYCEIIKEECHRRAEKYYEIMEEECREIIEECRERIDEKYCERIEEECYRIAEGCREIMEEDCREIIEEECRERIEEECRETIEECHEAIEKCYERIEEVCDWIAEECHRDIDYLRMEVKRCCEIIDEDYYYQQGEYCYYDCELVECFGGRKDVRNCKVEKKPCDEAKCTEDGWDTSECCDPSKKPKVLYYSDGNYCYYSCEPVCRNGNWFLENCSVSEKKCDTSKCTPTGWSECCERKPTGRRRCSESGGVEVEYLTEDCSIRWVKERDCLLGCSNGTCLESKKEVLLPPMLAILTVLITTRRRRRHLRRRVCKVCGKQIMSGWRICPHCGSLLEEEKRTKERESDTKIYKDKKKEEK